MPRPPPGAKLEASGGDSGTGMPIPYPVAGIADFGTTSAFFGLSSLWLTLTLALALTITLGIFFWTTSFLGRFLEHFLGRFWIGEAPTARCETPLRLLRRSASGDPGAGASTGKSTSPPAAEIANWGASITFFWFPRLWLRLRLALALGLTITLVVFSWTSPLLGG